MWNPSQCSFPWRWPHNSSEMESLEKPRHKMCNAKIKKKIFDFAVKITHAYTFDENDAFVLKTNDNWIFNLIFVCTSIALVMPCLTLSLAAQIPRFFCVFVCFYFACLLAWFLETDCDSSAENFSVEKMKQQKFQSATQQWWDVFNIEQCTWTTATECDFFSPFIFFDVYTFFFLRSLELLTQKFSPFQFDYMDVVVDVNVNVCASESIG